MNYLSDQLIRRAAMKLAFDISQIPAAAGSAGEQAAAELMDAYNQMHRQNVIRQRLFGSPEVAEDSLGLFSRVLPELWAEEPDVRTTAVRGMGGHVDYVSQSSLGGFASRYLRPRVITGDPLLELGARAAGPEATWSLRHSRLLHAIPTLGGAGLGALVAQRMLARRKKNKRSLGAFDYAMATLPILGGGMAGQVLANILRRRLVTETIPRLMV